MHTLSRDDDSLLLTGVLYNWPRLGALEQCRAYMS
jgi:hypothetical protein